MEYLIMICLWTLVQNSFFYIAAVFFSILDFDPL